MMTRRPKLLRPTDILVLAPQNREFAQIFVGHAAGLFVEEIHTLGSTDPGVEAIVQNQGKIFPPRFAHGDSFIDDVYQSEIDQLKNSLIEYVVIADLH